ADHQCVTRLAGAHELVRDGERVEKAAAGGLQAEGRRTTTTQTRLQQRAGIGEYQVGGRRADRDEIDILGLQAGGGDRRTRRLLGHIRVRFTLGCNSPALDAGTLTYPGVAGVHELLEIAVAEHPLRQIAAGANDARIHSSASATPWRPANPAPLPRPASRSRDGHDRSHRA